MRVELEKSYVIHSRPFRDTSLIVEFITPNYGRVSAVVRGVRSAGKAARAKRSLLQPFAALLIGWTGKTDLKTATHIESSGGVQLHLLQGPRLFSALYVNELLMRVVPIAEENLALFALYEWVLAHLSSDLPIDIGLRQFELRLLENLGFGIDFSAEAESDEPLQANCHYRYQPDHGFSRFSSATGQAPNNLFSGEDLQALATEQFTETSRKAAKRLCRLAIEARLGGKPLKSRELFI